MTLRQTLTRSADLARLGLPILTGCRARRPADAAAARRRLVAHMGRLHGLPQKIGQILSLGELDGDSAEPIYRTLTESRDATPAREAFDWIATELGAPVDTREAETLRRYAAHRAEMPRLVTPDPIDGLCTPRLLTMTWVDGDPFERVREWPERNRREVGRQLIELFLRGAVCRGELHADTHPGNLRFRRDLHGIEVGLLDFGCMQQLTTGARAALRRLLEPGPIPAAPDLRAVYLALGFNLDLLHPLLDKLGALTRLLTEPFHTPGPFDLGTWRLSARLAELLGDDRWNFRFAGPAMLLGFIRAFQGLLRYVSALRVPVDWHAVTTTVLDTRVPSQTIAGEFLTADTHPPETTSATTEDPSMPPQPTTQTSPASTALRIRVTRQGEQVVLLTFKPTLAAQLPDLIPEDLKPRLEARQLDIAHLAATAAANGYPPGDLFVLDEGEQTVRVWLE